MGLVAKDMAFMGKFSIHGQELAEHIQFVS